jgi:hypothetical protein
LGSQPPPPPAVPAPNPCFQVDNRALTGDAGDAQPAAASAGLDSTTEVRVVLDDVYVADIQPADPTVVGGLTSYIDSSGHVNAAALLATKPNCLVFQPSRHRILGVEVPQCQPRHVVRAWKRRHVFLRRSVAGSVLEASRAAVLQQPSSRLHSVHQWAHRTSDGFGEGGPTDFSVPIDEGSSSSGNEDQDDDGVRHAASWPGAPSQRRRLLRLIDGREFPGSDHISTLTVNVTLPGKSAEVAQAILAWKERSELYRSRQLVAWASGLPIPSPARDTAPTDTVSGVRISIQSDSVVFVHSKRFEDELKASIDVTIVSARFFLFACFLWRCLCYCLC